MKNFHCLTWRCVYNISDSVFLGSRVTIYALLERRLCTASINLILDTVPYRPLRWIVNTQSSRRMALYYCI